MSLGHSQWFLSGASFQAGEWVSVRAQGEGVPGGSRREGEGRVGQLGGSLEHPKYPWC